MQVNNTLRLIGLCLIFVAGCIDPFTPTIDETQELLVIEGQLTGSEGYQYITISRSSPYNDPHFMPELGCYVEVVDDQGNIFQFNETYMKLGEYTHWMSQESLVPGRMYKVHVVTWDGNEYESDYDMLTADCPPIDTVYYEIQTRETDDPDLPMNGIQLYVDVDSGDEVDRKFRWELTETWEYYAAYPIQYYFDGDIHFMSDPMQFYRCWSTKRISTIFIANTEHSTTNKIKKFPLNYVSDRSNRLKIKYSLLIRQYSMSDDAYNYWLMLKKQSQETGGLYETQPPQVTGNVYNVNDPEERVLGYFNVSSVTEKRIFVDEQFAFSFPGKGCRLDTITVYQLNNLYGPYPVYMISVNPMGEGSPYGIGNGICFDCREGGGTTNQPSFWK